MNNKDLKNIKVLIYTTIFSSGGAERFVLDLINNIDLKKFEIVLVVGRKNGTSYLNMLKEHEKIKYINLGFSDTEDYNIYKSLSKIIENEKPDICFAPGIFTNFILLDSLNEIDYKGKIIVRESNYISSRNLPDDISKIFLKYNRCNRIVSLTKGMKKDISKYGVQKDKIEIINNIVDVNYVKKEAEIIVENKEFNAIKNRKIIHVGRLEEQKNQKLLLDSFKIVLDKVKDIDLVIIGKGSRETELKEYANKIGIESKVHFLGFQDNPYYFIKNSDLLILSSLYEGLPHTLLETMALRIPIISTDCKTGPRDIFKSNKYGYLVKNNDVKKLSKKTISLLNNENKLNKKVNKAYERVLEYDVNKVIKEYEKLFLQVIGE